MKTTTCSKCGISTTKRLPECAGWTSIYTPETKEYIDLCPKCSEKFEDVKHGAWNVFNATIEAWLGCVEKESKIDLMEPRPDIFGDPNEEMDEHEAP